MGGYPSEQQKNFLWLPSGAGWLPLPDAATNRKLPEGAGLAKAISLSSALLIPGSAVDPASKELIMITV